MAVDYINTLGAGAGFNTKEIVTALIDAETAPQKTRIETKISDKESEISALGSATSQLAILDSAAKALNDARDFNNYYVFNSQSTALSVTANTDADIGAHSITVNSVAREQRTNINLNGNSDFNSKTQILNSGNAFDLSIVVGNSSTVTHSVSVTTSTPQGIVDAVNAAGIGITASLIDKGTSGTNYLVQLVGESGVEEQFTVTPTVNSLLNVDTPVGSTAADASLTVNGVTYARSNNQINDILTGLTLNLVGPTSGSASISVGRNTADVQSNITALVDAYNGAKAAMDKLTDRELEGALAGDTIFRRIVRSITNIFISASSTPGSSFKSLSDLGVSINKTGELEITETKLSSALTNNFEDVRKIFSADTNDQTTIGEANRGVSGDLTKLINDLTSSSGYLETRQSQLNFDIGEHKEDLSDLEKKMEALQSRYEKQFASMNALIDELNNTKDNLVSSLENLPFTNKD